MAKSLWFKLTYSKLGWAYVRKLHFSTLWQCSGYEAPRYDGSNKSNDLKKID